MVRNDALADKVTCFSDSASFLTMLAPGSQIMAAGISMNGTSQAAPHVAGAVAVLRAAFPGESLDQTVTRLTNGVMVTDSRNNIVKPRLSLPMALGVATSCTYSISETSKSYSSYSSSGSVAVTTGPGCTWSAASSANSASWITVTSGSNGSGNGTVTYSISANPNSAPRTGTITIAGQLYTVTQSGSVADSVNILLNSGFEEGEVAWGQTTANGLSVITSYLTPTTPTNTKYAWLCGYDNCADKLYQDVYVPSDAQGAILQFKYWITTSETTRASIYDSMAVRIFSPPSASTYASCTLLSNLNATTGWVQYTGCNLIGYKGQTIRVQFSATTDTSLSTDFFLDDVTLMVSGATLAVTPISQTIGPISFTPANLTVGRTVIASATATSGLPVSLSSTTPSVCTVSGSTVTGVTAGTCTIAANQAGNASYSAAPQVTQSITVTLVSHVTALFVHASTSVNKTSVIRITNTTGSAGTLTAIAYNESGTQLGTAGASLGAIAANQTLTFSSAYLESLIGFTPATPTSKYSVYFSANLSDFQVINYTRDNLTSNLTLSQSLATDRSSNATAASVTRNAWFMSAAASPNKTNVLRLVNTSNSSGTITAIAYDEAGNQVGTANIDLGTIVSHQMVTFFSSTIESALGFVPATPTSKYRVQFSANVPSLELINFTKDIATGNLTLVQAQLDDRPSYTGTTSTRNALLVYPSTNGSKYTMMRIINPNTTAASVTATVYDEAGPIVAIGSLETVGANQMLALSSSQIEAVLGYAPSSANARYRMALSANVPTLEVVNDIKDIATGNLYLAQAQTDNRAASSATSVSRNAYIIYPSASTLTTTQLEVINTTAQRVALAASAYDDNGTLVASNVGLGMLGANQMLTLSSAQLESLMHYTPPTSSSKWRIVFSANLSNFEVVNYSRDALTGNLVLAQPQTE